MLALRLTLNNSSARSVYCKSRHKQEKKCKRYNNHIYISCRCNRCICSMIVYTSISWDSIELSLHSFNIEGPSDSWAPCLFGLFVERLVSVVSTMVCGTIRVGSNPIPLPIDYAGVAKLVNAAVLEAVPFWLRVRVPPPAPLLRWWNGRHTSLRG